MFYKIEIKGDKMKYIGFQVDEETFEKLRTIEFVNNLQRSVLMKEGLQHILKKYGKSLEKLKDMAEKYDK